MGKLKLVLLGLQFLAGGLDAHATRHTIAIGGIEHNPLARPFVHSDALYASNAAFSLANYWLAKKLEHKHPKLSLVPQAVDASWHLSGYAYTKERSR